MCCSSLSVPAPCAPVIQDHSLDCATNFAWVSWAEDEDAVGFTVNATSSMGHAASCSSTTNTSCVLDQLLCGHTYTAHAVAKGNLCDSVPSQSFQITAGGFNVEYLIVLFFFFWWWEWWRGGSKTC